MIAASRGTASAARNRFHTPLLVLLLALSSVLLMITCVNVSTLLLARGRSRWRELMMRAALGASPGRLFAQPLIEGGLILAVSLVLVVCLGWAADAVLVRTFAAASPHFDLAVRPDGRVLAWTGAVIRKNDMRRPISFPRFRPQCPRCRLRCGSSWSHSPVE